MVRFFRPVLKFATDKGSKIANNIQTFFYLTHFYYQKILDAKKQHRKKYYVNLFYRHSTRVITHHWCTWLILILTSNRWSRRGCRHLQIRECNCKIFTCTNLVLSSSYYRSASTRFPTLYSNNNWNIESIFRQSWPNADRDGKKKRSFLREGRWRNGAEFASLLSFLLLFRRRFE